MRSKRRTEIGPRYRELVQKSKAWGVFPSLAFFVSADLLGALPLALGPAALDFRDIFVQPLFRDRFARPGHQILVIGEIDRRQRHHREDLSRLDPMEPIGARI